MQHWDAFGIPKLVSVFFLRQLSAPTTDFLPGMVCKQSCQCWMSNDTGFLRVNMFWPLTIGDNCLTYLGYYHLGPFWPAARMTSALASELNSRILTLEYRFANCVHVSTQANVLGIKFSHWIGKLSNSQIEGSKRTAFMPARTSDTTTQDLQPLETKMPHLIIAIQTPQMFPTNNVVALLPAPTVLHCATS